MTDRPVRRALLSVSDKTGLVEFARELTALGVALVSTGGTASLLRDAGLTVIDVATVTGAPGILDGRVKTLHPAVHGGILARRDLPAHMATLEALDIAPIDLVAVNLYPFEATIAGGADDAAALEMVDIGGPALLRAAAKNHPSVTVVSDPADYGPVIAALKASGGAIGEMLRRTLAAKAFARTAAYDAAIARWFAARQGEVLPERLILGASRREVMRYGENPHQRAAFYVTASAGPSVAAARQVQGKALSYNNLADADAAFELVSELSAPAVAIIKHANPCGVAVDRDLAAAHAKALACDPESAYGGIVAVNRPLDRAAAEQIATVFTEVVIAPDADEAAQAALAAKQNLAPAADRRPARAAAGRAAAALGERRHSGAGARCRAGRRARAQGGHRARADAGRARRSALRLRGLQARQVERDRVRPPRRHGRHRRRADEPGRRGAHRGREGRATERARGREPVPDRRQRGRLGRVLPVPGRPRCRAPRRRHRRDPAGRQHARRRGDRGRRSGRRRDGVHRHPPFPALTEPSRRFCNRAACRDLFGLCRRAIVIKA